MRAELYFLIFSKLFYFNRSFSGVSKIRFMFYVLANFGSYTSWFSFPVVFVTFDPLLGVGIFYFFSDACLIF